MNGHAGASCYCRQIGKKSVDNFPNCAHFFACPSSRPVRPAPDSSFAYLFMQRPATRPKGKLIYFWFVFFFLHGVVRAKGVGPLFSCKRFKLKCFGGKKRRPDAGGRTSPGLFCPNFQPKKADCAQNQSFSSERGSAIFEGISVATVGQLISVCESSSTRIISRQFK